VANQGFSSSLSTWGAGKDDSKPNSISKKRENFTAHYSDRLNTTQIESNDAINVIERYDSVDSFFYIDPPYFNSNMAHYAGYTKFNYEILLNKLSKIKGKFLLSSYPSDELNEQIIKNQWQSKCIERPIAVTKNTNKRKTEMMVYNYRLPVFE
jgi:DNA adenine methylase